MYQHLTVNNRLRSRIESGFLPFPPSKETVCLITTGIDGVNTTRTNHCGILVPPLAGPPSECDSMQVDLHP
jgi:hypothetical protein